MRKLLLRYLNRAFTRNRANCRLGSRSLSGCQIGKGSAHCPLSSACQALCSALRACMRTAVAPTKPWTSRPRRPILVSRYCAAPEISPSPGSGDRSVFSASPPRCVTTSGKRAETCHRARRPNNLKPKQGSWFCGETQASRSAETERRFRKSIMPLPTCQLNLVDRLPFVNCETLPLRVLWNAQAVQRTGS